MDRARRAVDVLDLATAAELFEAVFVLADALGERELAGESKGGLGVAAHLGGDLATAVDRYAEAIELLEEGSAKALVRARRAFARYDLGELEAAEPELRELARCAPTPELRARATGYLGNVLRARGAIAEAVTAYDEAEEALATSNETFAAVFAMDRAIAWMLAGRLEEAAAALEELAQRRAVVAVPNVAGLVDHYRRLARAVLRLPGDDGDASPAVVPSVRALHRLRTLATEPAVTTEELLERAADLGASSNAHVRITLQLLEARGRLGARDEGALVVARRGTYFRLGAEAPVLLAPRGPQPRMLAALAAARVENPGSWVGAEALAAATWPDERMRPEARKNRLHVTIASLRKVGLRSVLASKEGAYRLSPDVRTVLLD